MAAKFENKSRRGAAAQQCKVIAESKMNNHCKDVEILTPMLRRCESYLFQD
jgi:hypothetical protein